MRSIRRILWINTQQPISLETTVLLKVAGYQVEYCTDLNEAINRHGLYRDSDKAFDLVIATVGKKEKEVLERCYCCSSIDRLILFQPQLSCPTRYCRSGSHVNLCNSVALIPCLDEIQTSGIEPFANFGGLSEAVSVVK